MPGHLAIGPQQPSYVATALQVPCPRPYPPMTSIYPAMELECEYRSKKDYKQFQKKT